MPKDEKNIFDIGKESYEDGKRIGSGNATAGDKAYTIVGIFIIGLLVVSCAGGAFS